MSLKQYSLLIMSMNIQYGIGKIFGFREIEYSMGVKDYFGRWWTNRPHATPNYWPGKYKFEVDYYRQTYCSPEKLPCIRKTVKNQVKR